MVSTKKWIVAFLVVLSVHLAVNLRHDDNAKSTRRTISGVGTPNHNGTEHCPTQPSPAHNNGTPTDLSLQPLNGAGNFLVT